MLAMCPQCFLSACYKLTNLGNVCYKRMTRILLLRQLFEPLLGRTRSRGRCSAAIRLSHRPEPSGHAIHGEVGGLDMREQHCRQFVLLRHTQVAEEAISHLYKQERKRPTPVRRRLGRTHRLFLEWSFRGGGCRCRG